MLVRLLSGVWTWSCAFDKWGRSCYAVKRWLDSGRSLFNVKWEEKAHTRSLWVSNELQIFPEESQKRNSGFSFSKVSCCHYKPGEQLCCNTEVDVVHSWCLWFWPKRRGGLRWTAATSPPSIQPMAGVCKKNTVTSSPTAALDCWAICTLVKGSLER